MREPNVRKHVEEMLQFIRTNGGDIKIFHRKNPTDSSGNRQVWHDVWMTKEDEEIRHGTPLDTELVYIHADQCLGYTIAKATIDNKSYVGKAICSSKDNYNGNIGAIRALNDLMDQLRSERHPIAQAWIKHIALQRDIRKHARQNPDIMIPDNTAKVIDFAPTT